MKQGLNSLDWLEVSSKIKQANDFQLNFLKEVISSEEIKRKGQQGYGYYAIMEQRSI